MIFSPTNIVI